MKIVGMSESGLFLKGICSDLPRFEDVDVKKLTLSYFGEKVIDLELNVPLFDNVTGDPDYPQEAVLVSSIQAISGAVLDNLMQLVADRELSETVAGGLYCIFAADEELIRNAPYDAQDLLGFVDFEFTLVDKNIGIERSFKIVPTNSGAPGLMKGFDASVHGSLYLLIAEDGTDCDEYYQIPLGTRPPYTMSERFKFVEDKAVGVEFEEGKFVYPTDGSFEIPAFAEDYKFPMMTDPTDIHYLAVRKIDNYSRLEMEVYNVL